MKYYVTELFFREALSHRPSMTYSISLSYILCIFFILLNIFVIYYNVYCVTLGDLHKSTLYETVSVFSKRIVCFSQTMLQVEVLNKMLFCLNLAVSLLIHFYAPIKYITPNQTSSRNILSRKIRFISYYMLKIS